MNIVCWVEATLLSAEQNRDGALTPTKPPKASQPRNLRLFITSARKIRTDHLAAAYWA
jgi:hypothetical protein